MTYIILTVAFMICLVAVTAIPDAISFFRRTADRKREKARHFREAMNKLDS